MASHDWTKLAQQIGQRFAAAVAEQPIVQTLWASPDEDGIELWLVTAPADPNVERPLYPATTALRRQFPDTDIRVNIINRRNYPTIDLNLVIPEKAILIARFAGAE
jgi:hypothetical protein